MKSVFIVLFIVLMVVPTASAQQSRTLTLESAIDLALQKNVGVIQAKNSFEAQSSATQAAVGDLLPDLNASASFSRNQSWRNTPAGTYINEFGIPTDYPAQNRFTASNTFSTGISSRVILFNGFANTSNLTRAQANATASEYSLNRTEQSTIYNTHSLFLNVVRNYQLLKVSEENLKRSKRQLERISESNKVGAVALADVYRQQVQVGSDELSLIQSESNFEKAKADLIAFLGVDFDDTEYAVDFSGIPTNIDTTEFASLNQQYADFNSLVKTALDRRPDYQSSVENVKSADASVTMARAGHFPTISASGSFGYNNNELSNITDNRGLQLGLSVNLPIFSGFGTQNQIEQSQVSYKNAQEGLHQSRRQITVDIRKALLDLESSQKQVMVTQTSVQSAEMDRKIAEEKYNLGAGTLLDLLVANANFTTAQSNKVNAVIGYLLSKKQTEFALGIISK